MKENCRVKLKGYLVVSAMLQINIPTGTCKIPSTGNHFEICYTEHWSVLNKVAVILDP